jgi:hypothetical protein
MIVYVIEVPIVIPADEHFRVTGLSVINAISSQYDSALLICPPNTEGAIQLDLETSCENQRLIKLLSNERNEIYAEPYLAAQEGYQWADGFTHLIIPVHSSVLVDCYGKSFHVRHALISLHDFIEYKPQELSEEEELPF